MPAAQPAPTPLLAPAPPPAVLPAVLHLPGPPSTLARPGPHLEVRTPGSGAPRRSGPARAPSRARSAATALAAAGARRPTRHPGMEGLRVFSVDDRSVQLHWSASVEGPLRFGAGPSTVEVAGTAPAFQPRGGRSPRRLSRLACGPGTAVIDDLPHGSELEAWVETPVGRAVIGTVRTLPRPPGAPVAQLATVTDIHVGEYRFSFGGLEDRWPLPEGGPYSLRCAAVAIAEAVEWGATHLVVKGDLTRDSEPGEFEAVGRLLAGAGVPTDVVLGNHDVRHHVDGPAILARWGIDATPTTRVTDLPGLRIVLAHSPNPRDHWGELPDEELDRIAAAAGAAPGGCMVVAHHAPLTGPITTHYPPGMRAAPSRALLGRLAEAHPASVIVAGHTHRNRVRWSQGIVCAETGSTKDHPGTWTGYRVFEGGIVQTARRTAGPTVLPWTEATRRALASQWGRWSPGVLADRSWALEWPRPAS